MVSRRTDKLLYKLTHHTNYARPHSEYVTGSKYPEQNQGILGTTITLRYKTMYKSDVNHINNTSPDKYSPESNIFEGEFIIVRFDLTPPNKFIGISRDYKVILVGNSNDSLENIQNKIYEYPLQLNEYIGLYLINKYYYYSNSTDIVQTNAVVLSCDNGEPCHTVIAEFWSENKTRFLLGDEVDSIVLDRYDEDGERDFTGKDAGDHGRVYIDLNGDYANAAPPITRDADAGYADPLRDLYRKDILTLKEVCKLRRRILIERQIYGDIDINVRDISLTDSFLAIKVGETHQLVAKILPENATNQNIIWTSSDNNICSVSNTGLVTPLHGGLVAICATTEDGGYRAYCRFKITVDVTGVVITDYPEEINIGDTYQLESQIIPEEATNPEVIWSSSNIENIRIDTTSGLITAVHEGSSDITVTTVDGGFEDNVTINSIKPIHPVTGLSIKAVSYKGEDDHHIVVPKIGIEYPDIILYRLFPQNATDPNTTWETSGGVVILGLPSIPDLPTTGDTLGHIPYIKVNNYYTEGRIDAKTVDGNYQDRIYVTARNAIKSIDIQNPGDIIKNTTGLLYARADLEFNDYDSTRPNVTWTSSDPSILRIENVPYKAGDKNIFKARYSSGPNYGQVEVTITTQEDYYGTFTDTFTVNVAAGFIPIEAIVIDNIDAGNINLSTNGTNNYPRDIIVHAHVEPEDATVQKIEGIIYDNWVEDASSIEKIGVNQWRITGNKYDGNVGSRLVLFADDTKYGGMRKEHERLVKVTDYVTSIVSTTSIQLDPYGAQSEFYVDLEPTSGAYVEFNSSGQAEDFTVYTTTPGLISISGPDIVKYNEDDYNKLTYKVTGINPGTTNIIIETIDKDGNPLTAHTAVTVGTPPGELFINDYGADWVNMEFNDVVEVTVNTDVPYYEQHATFEMESSNPSILSVERIGNNRFALHVNDKGFNVTIVARVNDLVDPTIIYTCDLYIPQVGTHHFATEIETRGAEEIYFPAVNTSIDNRVYAKVDGDVGIIVYELSTDGVPINITETEYIHNEWRFEYEFAPNVVDFSNYGNANLILRAVDPDPEIGDVIKTIPIRWGNPVVSASIDEETTVLTTDVLFGQDFPVSNINAKINVEGENPDYPVTIKTCEWESSDTSVFTISGNEFETTYTVLKPGKADLTVTSTDGSYSDSAEVNVYGIKFDSHSLTLLQRDTYQLEPIVHLPDYFDYRLLFTLKSTAPIGVATVTSDGLVTAVNPGTTVIMVTDSYSQAYIDEITITVEPKENPLVDVHWSNNNYEENVDYGPIYDPTTQFLTQNTGLYMIGNEPDVVPTYPVEDIIFTSSDESVAIFDHVGQAVGVTYHDIHYKLYKPGTCNITAKTNTGEFITTANVKVYGLRFDSEYLDLVVDNIVDLNTKVSSYVNSGAGNIVFITYDPLTNRSVNTDIIDVVQQGSNYVIANGIINAKKTGSVYIKAYYSNRTDSYDIIKLTISKNPVRRCADIIIEHNYPDEQNKFFIKDETDIRLMKFKQVDQNGDLFEETVQVSVSVVQSDDIIEITYFPGSFAQYPMARISIEQRLVQIGDATLMITSADGACTKSFPIHYGNRLQSTSFPDEYSDFEVDLGNLPSSTRIKLDTVCEYTEYKPSSNCVWASSNPAIVSVDPNGGMVRMAGSEYYEFYTTYTPHMVGTTTISATTSNGIKYFDIEVYDSVTPVSRDFLNIHQIDMIYTTDPLQYQLAIFGEDLQYAQIDYESEDTELATVIYDGEVKIVDVPDRNKFEYYDADNNPKTNVYIDFYITVTASLPKIKYQDKCKIHIKGESLAVETAVPVIMDSDIANISNMAPDTNYELTVRVTPYYIKDNLDSDTIDFEIVEKLTPATNGANSLTIQTPIDQPAINGSFNINTSINIATATAKELQNIVDEEFNFNMEYPISDLVPPVGPDWYDYDDDSKNPGDHDFNEDFTTQYDQDVYHKTIKLKLVNPRNVYGKFTGATRSFPVDIG